MPRRTDPRRDADYSRILDRMPSVLRQRCREFYTNSSGAELRRLGVRTSIDAHEMSAREMVLIAEEIVRVEREYDSIDEVLKETEEDYA